MPSLKKIFLKNNAVILFFIGVFIFLYFLNAIFPTQSDDIDAIFGGLTAAINSFNNWNGRFGELLRVSFGSYLTVTPFYAPMNALVGTSVIFLLFVAIFAKKPQSVLKDISILLVLIVFLLIDIGSCFGSFFYWAAGSFNYLWAWLLILLWILPYRFYWQGVIVNKKKYLKDNNIIKTIFLLVVGFFAGWSTEFGIVFVFLQMCSIIYSYFVRKESLPNWYFVGVIAMLAGWFFLYTCPGTSARISVWISYGDNYLSLSEILKMTPIDFISTVMNTYNRVLRWPYYENYVSLSLFIILTSFFYKPNFKKISIGLFIILSMLVFLFLMPRFLFLLYIIFISSFYAIKFRQKDKRLYIFFAIFSFVLFAEFIFIGSTIQKAIPRRAGFQYSFLNFILIAIIMTYCFDKFRHNFKIRLTAFICCLFINLSMIYFVSLECYRMSIKWSLMVESIKEQKNKGIRDIIVDKKTFVPKYWSYGDWANPDENFTEWPNTSYAQVYGVDTFTAK